MKKIYLLLVLVSFSVSLSGQLGGDGSSSNPFYGTITSSVTWDWESIGDFDGKIYVGTASSNDLTIDTGGHLTILPGATIVFTQLTSDLIVTGSGRITANGFSTLGITFTKATANENWGHIIFDNMSGTNASLFNYCTIEYGKKTGTTLVLDNVGGGICANYTYLTITNSTFRNNYALFGGGIFVGYAQNPVISNNRFINNQVREAGGGIYVYNESAVVINNCIFDGNAANGVTSPSYGGGGIQFGINTTNAKVVNSTFVNNYAFRGGNGAYFYSSGSTVNCIYWGSSNQVYFRTTTGSAINCAIQNYVASPRFSNCFNLNATNSATDGPNFVAVDGSDWSVRFISPCRNSGTDTGAPATDIAGKSRISTADIGAFEVQYSHWLGNAGTTWSNASNWDKSILPVSGSSNVIIPSGRTNYPTGTGVNYTIGNGYNLIIESGGKATFGTLTNSGGLLYLKSNATGIASLIFSSYTDSGTEKFEMYLTGGGGPNYRWHYIAVPASMNKSTFTSINPYNLLLYDESKIVTTNMEGWQWHDGYDGTTSFTTLLQKKGYNFYHTANVTVTLPTVTGLLSTMGASVGLQYSGNGLNLIGNSLTSSLNWDLAATSGNMRDAIYFTKDNALVSYVDGVGVPSGTTGIIPPFQGFMVKALEPGCSIDFTAAGVKTHSTVNRYKTEELYPLIRMQLNKETVPQDETVIRVKSLATIDFDNRFDASKLFSGEATKPQLYSTLQGEKFSINTVPYPDTPIEIPLSVSIREEGNYVLEVKEIENFSNYRVDLLDLVTSTQTDLTDINFYSFSSSPGIFDARFVVRLSPMGVGVEKVYSGDKHFQVYISDRTMNVTPVDDSYVNTSTRLNVYDLLGRRVLSTQNLYWNRGEIKQFEFPHPEGIYLVEITTGSARTVVKVSNR